MEYLLFWKMLRIKFGFAEEMDFGDLIEKQGPT